jgi:small subunit ribosomal protein S5
MASEPQQNQQQEQPVAAEGAQTSAPQGGGRGDRGGRGGGGGRGGRGGGRGGDRGGRGGGRGGEREDRGGIDDQLVKLYRCATVVKGGRRFSFGALVVCGDRAGRVGFGYGKANEVPQAVDKGVKYAKKRLQTVPLRGSTIPHRVIGQFGASRILLLPASEGTGVIAGAAPRAVLELAGVRDVLTKCYGSTNAKNLVKATLDGLRRLRTRNQIEQGRGVPVDLPADRRAGEVKDEGPAAPPMEAYVG